MANKRIAKKQTGIRVGSASEYPGIDFEGIDKDADEQWEKRERGEGKHPKAASQAQAAKLDKMIDEALLTPVTIRLQSDLIQNFKRFAHEDGLKYQSLMRSVLTKYMVRRRKK